MATIITSNCHIQHLRKNRNSFSDQFPSSPAGMSASSSSACISTPSSDRTQDSWVISSANDSPSGEVSAYGNSGQYVEASLVPPIHPEATQGVGFYEVDWVSLSPPSNTSSNCGRIDSQESESDDSWAVVPSRGLDDANYYHPDTAGTEIARMENFTPSPQLLAPLIPALSTPLSIPIEPIFQCTDMNLQSPNRTLLQTFLSEDNQYLAFLRACYESRSENQSFGEAAIIFHSENATSSYIHPPTSETPFWDNRPPLINPFSPNLSLQTTYTSVTNPEEFSDILHSIPEYIQGLTPPIVNSIFATQESVSEVLPNSTAGLVDKNAASRSRRRAQPESQDRNPKRPRLLGLAEGSACQRQHSSSSSPSSLQGRLMRRPRRTISFSSNQGTLGSETAEFPDRMIRCEPSSDSGLSPAATTADAIRNDYGSSVRDQFDSVLFDSSHFAPRELAVEDPGYLAQELESLHSNSAYMNSQTLPEEITFSERIAPNTLSYINLPLHSNPLPLLATFGTTDMVPELPYDQTAQYLQPSFGYVRVSEDLLPAGSQDFDPFQASSISYTAFPQQPLSSSSTINQELPGPTRSPFLTLRSPLLIPHFSPSERVIGQQLTKYPDEGGLGGNGLVETVEVQGTSYMTQEIVPNIRMGESPISFVDSGFIGSQGASEVSAVESIATQRKKNSNVLAIGQIGRDMANGTQPHEHIHIESSEAEDNEREAEGQQRKKRKKKGPYNPERREEVNKMRGLGACWRCKFTKGPCGPGDPCPPCEKLQAEGKAKIWNLPCTRMKITDAQLFRVGNSKFSQATSSLIKYNFLPGNGNRRKTLILGRGNPNQLNLWRQSTLPHPPTLKIHVKQFTPSPDDLLYETWIDPVKGIQHLKLPPFTADNPTEAHRAVKNYIQESFPYFTIDMTSQKDKLVNMVFDEAIRQSKLQSSMIRDALHLWIGSRISAEGLSIFPSPTDYARATTKIIGIEMERDPFSPYYQTVPVPPALDHVIDTVGIQYMVGLQKKILKKMQGLLKNRKILCWYEVFLTMFVLLSNLEFVYRAQYDYMKRHLTPKTGQNIKGFTFQWMNDWESAAKWLIMYFQISLKGAFPFELDWDYYVDDLVRQPGGGFATETGRTKQKNKNDIAAVINSVKLDDDAVRFLGKVRVELRKRRGEFLNLRDRDWKREYDVDLVWCSQLFLDGDWGGNGFSRSA